MPAQRAMSGRRFARLAVVLAACVSLIVVAAAAGAATNTIATVAGTGVLFQVLQSRRRSSKGIVEVRLKGSNFRRCRLPSRSASASGPQADTAARRRYRRTVRRGVRGNARGRFRTRGRYSAATVRGTIWP